MTQDIILDTTVRVIRANERHLQLAFQVEKAMPVVREELIKEFFECVEKQLKEKVETTEGWEIRATGTEGLWMRKKSWDRLKVREHNVDGWWGISLYREEGDSSWIGVANIEKTPEEVKKQIRDKFREYIGEPDTDEQYIWHYLEGDLSDLTDLNFLKKMVNDEKREEITKDMADKLAKLAVAVDEALSNSG